MNTWDRRYDEERYFYGTEPNYLVARELPLLPPGRLLCLAEGEGRNAVFAAGLGHQVTAVDSSAVGRRKALQLAVGRGVLLDYRCEDVVTAAWDAQPWDVIVLCFAHLDPKDMPAVHARCAQALVPGGTLILNSFAKAQFGRKSGGPPRLDWLHDLQELKTQFPGVTLRTAREVEVALDEAAGHRGPAMVLELVGTRD